MTPLSLEAARYAGAGATGLCPIASEIIWLLPGCMGTTMGDIDAPWWQPCPDGEPLQTLPAIASVYDPPDDILAWRPSAPGRVFRRIGAPITRLGIWTGSGPITLYPHPKAWAEAGGDGCCVLDWPAVAPELRLGRRAIRCVGEKFTAFVRKQIEDAAPPMPAVSVRRGG